jgi:hypothetical protein
MLKMKQTDRPIDELYANFMQLISLTVDCNKLFVVAGRGSGKTEFLGMRSIRVAESMPRETSALTHKTYIALLNNVVPNLLAYYNSPRGKNGRPLLREGIDYVVGQKDLPKHFIRPRYPLTHPEHTICFANGHNFRLVSSDQPESIAGSNIVHIFIEEMKHNKGDKLKTRLFPAMRIGRLAQGAEQTAQSPYYGGITGVSDVARISLGEDDWFDSYEKLTNPELIEDIINLAIHIDTARYNVYTGKLPEKNLKIIDRYLPVLNHLKSLATFYIRVSSLVNKDILGIKFFQTQSETLSISELMTSIYSINERITEDMFFPRLDEEKHFFDDSYKYELIQELNLKDKFKLDASYLKHYNPSDKILIGYDPGSFASLVVAQEDKKNNTLRFIKEFYVIAPKDIEDLAQDFCIFFKNRRTNFIDFYYDRAGNKKDSKRDAGSDARQLKKAIEKYGFRVRMMNENQRDIFHWEHYKLWDRILSCREKEVPKFLFDSNECPYLKSSLFACKKIPGKQPVELDKSPERNLPLSMQAGLSPQIPSAAMYLAWGLYHRFCPDNQEKGIPVLPGNMVV